MSELERDLYQLYQDGLLGKITPEQQDKRHAIIVAAEQSIREREGTLAEADHADGTK